MVFQSGILKLVQETIGINPHREEMRLNGYQINLLLGLPYPTPTIVSYHGWNSLSLVSSVISDASTRVTFSHDEADTINLRFQ